jgi:WD40 repeat protein
VLTSGKGRVAHVWCASSPGGKPQLELKGHTGRVWTACLAPAHAALVTGGWDGAVRVWNERKGVCTALLGKHDDQVWALALLAGPSALLASAGRDGGVRIWDLDTVEPYWRAWSTASEEEAASMAPPRHVPHRVGADPLVAHLRGDGSPALVIVPLAAHEQLAAGYESGSVLVWHARLASPLRSLQHGHGASITALAPMADGSLVSGCADGRLLLWRARPEIEAAAASSVAEQAGADSAAATAEAASPGSSAAGSPRGPTEDEDPLAELIGHGESISAALPLPDGRLLSGSHDGTLRLWDASSVHPLLAVLRAHRGAVTALQLLRAADGEHSLVASGDSENTLCHWDVSGGLLVRMQGGAAFGAQGASKRLFAAAAPAEPVEEAASDPAAPGPLPRFSGRWTFALPAGSPGLASVRFQVDSQDGTLVLRALPPPPPAGKPGSPTPPAAAAEAGQEYAVMPLLLLSDGRVAAVDGKAISVWRSDAASCGAGAGAAAMRLEGHSDTVWDLAELPRPGSLSGAGSLLVSASWDGALRLWDCGVSAGGACLAILAGHSKRVWTLTVLSARCVLSGSWDGTLAVWHAGDALAAAARGEAPAPAARLADVSTGGGEVWSAAALGEHYCASGGADGTVTVWHVASGGMLHSLGGGSRGHTGPVSALCPLGGGRLLSGGWDGTCRLWHAQMGVCERVLTPTHLAAGRGPDGSVWRGKVSAFAPLGGGRVAAASSDGVIRVWDAAAGELLAELRDHCSWVTQLAAMPGGQLLSCGPDNSVRVWDLGARRCSRVLLAPPEADAAYAIAAPSHCYTVGRTCLSLGPGTLVQGECRRVMGITASLDL